MSQLHKHRKQMIMDQALADYITAHTPISPSIQGRVTPLKITPKGSTWE